MEYILRTLAVTIVVPGAAGLGLAIASRRWSAESSVHRSLLAAAIAVAVVAGSWGVMGRPTLAPLDISSWLPHVAILGCLGAIAATWLPPGARTRYVVTAVVACSIAYLLLRPLLAQMSATRAVATFSIGAGSLWIYMAVLDLAARRTSPRVGATVALISTSAAAAAVAASGTISVAQVGGAAAAGIGGIWLVVLIRPSAVTATSLPIACVAWAVLALGNRYATLSLPIACCVLAVPVVALGMTIVAARWQPRTAALAILGATAAGAAVAVALAVTAGLPADVAEGSGSDDNYGYE